jgi:DNA-binding MarR family transcriptional regulator|tara:strand:- start:6676 stop:6954 length:279 start_codon:yes stop_codon:yes gene_type:complete
MHQHSIETYKDIIDTLPRSRANVLSVIRQFSGVTRQGIAKTLDWEINRVTGRVKELIDAGVIVEEGHISLNGHKRALLTEKKDETQVNRADS